MAEVYDEFDSDTHRRVAANLAQPRSVGELAEFLRANDPYVDESAYTAEGAAGYVADLEADGLVKKLGTFDGGADLVGSIAGDDDLRSLHPSKAKAVKERAARRDVGPFLDEDQYLATDRFYQRVEADRREAR